VINDVVQQFINQIVFLRICEDRNLPLYHNLKETIIDEDQMKKNLYNLFCAADKRYNSGLFEGEYIIFDLDSIACRPEVSSKACAFKDNGI